MAFDDASTPNPSPPGSTTAHGLTATLHDQFNADLLAFLRS
jgi:hypothetical protein